MTDLYVKSFLLKLVELKYVYDINVSSQMLNNFRHAVSVSNSHETLFNYDGVQEWPEKRLMLGIGHKAAEIN